MDRANEYDETGSEGFDYSCLDRETCTQIQVYAVEIRSLMKRASQDVVVVGQKLIMVKEQLPHGQFGPWLRAEFAWSERTARQFMSVAEAFKTVNFADLVVAPSALYVLAAPSTKVKVEYKTDFKGHRSERAFVEIISVDRKGKLGWAYLSEADFLIYYLSKLKVVYVISFADLRGQLRRWHRLYEVVSVSNPTYQTHGLLVPLCEFEEIARDVISC